LTIHDVKSFAGAKVKTWMSS